MSEETPEQGFERERAADRADAAPDSCGMGSNFVSMYSAFDPERDFWGKIIESAIVTGIGCEGEVVSAEILVATAAHVADVALIAWRKRFPQQKVDTNIFAPMSPMPMPRPIFGVEELISAQQQVERQTQAVEALRNLRDQMPEELGAAYYAVEGKNAEERLKCAEEWVSSIQKHMEQHEATRSAVSAPPAPLPQESGTKPATSTEHARSDKKES